ncbi:MAG: S9 family peptidase, partial [Acidimicrobiia bacterium]
GPGDSSPRWSPDGTRLAFLRKGPGDKDVPQAAVMPASGGEAATVTEFDLGVREVSWSPDGSTLAAVGVTWIDGWSGLDEEERARMPRRITRAGWREDELGWLHDRRSHIFLVDPAGRQGARQLTAGDFDEAGPRWHPGGGEIAFISARHETRGLDEGAQPWRIPIEGGAPEPGADVGLWWQVTYRPDGTLHLVGLRDRWGYPDNVAVWRVEPDGSLSNLTGHLDRNVVPLLPPSAPFGPQWVGDRFLTVVEDRGRLGLIEVSPDGAVEQVVGGDRAITGMSPRADGSAVAFVATTPSDPGELWWWENGTTRPLTSLNAEFRQTVPLVDPRPFTVERDGVEIDGWVYLPEGEDRVPLLLTIHGGPATQYGFGFFDEFQVYAGAGYGVVAANPRGSSGYGRSFMQAVVERWIEDRPPDLEDLVAVVDAALARFPRLDPDRLGIMGGSYGGFMAARILGEEHRFRSAIVERGLYSFTSFAGTSDIGFRFDRMYLGASPSTDWEALWQASPLSRAHQIATPTLVLHSESDFRCPVEQAEQLFGILLRQGVATELVRFPEEGHELSRSGKPRHRKERFEIILDWHRRYLAEPTGELRS